MIFIEYYSALNVEELTYQVRERAREGFFRRIVAFGETARRPLLRRLTDRSASIRTPTEELPSNRSSEYPFYSRFSCCFDRRHIRYPIFKAEEYSVQVIPDIMSFYCSRDHLFSIL